MRTYVAFWIRLHTAPLFMKIARIAVAADLVGGEALTCGRFAAPSIQDSSDHFIGIENRQTPQQRDRIFVGALSHGLESRDRDIERRDGAAAPTQGQVGVTFGPLEVED